MATYRLLMMFAALLGIACAVLPWVTTVYGGSSVPGFRFAVGWITMAAFFVSLVCVLKGARERMRTGPRVVIVVAMLIVIGLTSAFALVGEALATRVMFEDGGFTADFPKRLDIGWYATLVIAGVLGVTAVVSARFRTRG